MKAFVFRLQSVLLLREREEQAAQQEYAAALQALLVAQRLLQDAERLRDELDEAFAERRQHGFRAAEQNIFWASMMKHHEGCRLRAENFAKSAAEVERLRLQMLEAKRKSETMLHLKEKQQLAYKEAERHADDLLIDDMVSARYAAELRKVTA